jgi:hypothetical protein
MNSKNCVTVSPAVYYLAFTMIVASYGMHKLPCLHLHNLTSFCSGDIFALHPGGGDAPNNMLLSSMRSQAIAQVQLFLVAGNVFFICSPFRVQGIPEPGPTGATPADLDNLEKTVFSEHDVAPEGEECCAICLGDYEAQDELRVLPCKHTFHVSCVDEWLLKKATCPRCR